MRQSLWDLRTGDTRRLAGFTESLDETYQTRLGELGFQPGTLVTCVMRPALGAPRVYRIQASVFSLEDSVAREVLVEAEAPPPPSGRAQEETVS
jgi:Fe2+ transport system protein FeoA